MDVAAAIERTLAREAGPPDRRRFALGLIALENPAVCLVSTGSATPFSRRNRRGRERMLLRWSRSRLPDLRSAFQTLKRMAAFYFFTVHDASGSNPNLAVFDFPNPWQAPPQPAPPANPDNPIRPHLVTSDTVMEADAVVVGSGAGGSVVAALLAKSGRKVVVLEQGEALTESDYGSDEGEGFDRMFLKAGLLASEDVGIAVIAGRVLGGGTTVNWMTSFRPSDRLLTQWAEASGVPGLTGVGLQHSLDEVERRLNVGREAGALNAHNERLARGAEALGWHYAFQPRNANGCGDCGMCTFGCQWGGKQSTPRTYLQDAYDAGAVVVARANASRVLIKGGSAFAVEATVGPVGAMPARAEGAQRLTVRAPLVVVAAGSIESPALLLRSGLRHRALGRNLYLHPVAVLQGVYDEDVPAWTGPFQTVYSDQLADLDGRGYGVKLETSPIYPGLVATGLSWQGGAAFKREMLRLRHTGTLILICRDRRGGRVSIDRWGNAHVNYRLGRQEAGHLLHGLKEGAKLLLAAGAREAQTLHTRPAAITREERDDSAAWARYTRQVDRWGAAPNDLMLFSAHQMGTCRMSASPSAGVVDGTGAVHGVRGLYVADASVFPLSSGINPMITTMGLAHWIGSRLAQ